MWMFKPCYDPPPPPLFLESYIPIPFFHEEFFFLLSDSVRFRFSSESGTIKREEKEDRIEEVLHLLCANAVSRF